MLVLIRSRRSSYPDRFFYSVSFEIFTLKCNFNVKLTSVCKITFIFLVLIVIFNSSSANV